MPARSDVKRGSGELMMRVTSIAAAAAAGAATAFASTSPLAQTAAKIDPADTAWMISATALVLMMTIPGLALFYAGMVRKKNVLATMAQCLAATALCSILWAGLGYTLVFGGDAPLLGTLDAFCCAAWAWTQSVPLPRRFPKRCS
jgi:ammonium transporter, Amt family